MNETTHFTMHVRRTFLQKLKSIARRKSMEEDREISASEIVRSVLKKEFPELKDDRPNPDQTSQTSL